MEIKRRTEILIETSREFTVCQTDASEEFFCPQCGNPMLAAEHAAAVFSISRRAAYRFAELQSAHLIETGAGIVMLCLPTLLAATLVETAIERPEL